MNNTFKPTIAMAFPKIVAVCGVMRSGKDTVSNHLCDKYGYENVKIADTLKKTVSMLFNFNHDQIEGSLKDTIDPYWGITPRKAMQFFGTEVMKYEIQKILPDVGRTFWMSSLVSKLDSMPTDKLFVVSDMRFIHEYEYLVNHYKKENVFVIKLNRPSIQSSTSTHQSEKEIELIKEDILICNDGTITCLYKKIDDCMKNLIKLNYSMS